MEYGEARLHVPLCGADAMQFQVAGKPVPMRTGEVWYINADMQHEVINHGDQDRINLVIDCEVNNWLRSLIVSGDHYAPPCYHKRQQDEDRH